MSSAVSAETVSARATGALVFTAFGCLWLLTGLKASGWLNIATGVGVAIIAAALIAAALRLLKRAAKASQGEKNAEETEEKRVFRQVNIIQWIGVVAVIVLANVFRRPQFIIPGISIVVGLHLFPLARLFRYPVHYVTGTLLVVWSVAVMIFFSSNIIASVGALSTAAILLLSATYTLALASRAAKQM